MTKRIEHLPWGAKVTREDWLNQAAELMRTWFKEAGNPLPDKVHVSIGFTGSRSKKAIGACWSVESSEDGRCQVYIVPTLKGEAYYLEVLAHELCHASLPTGTGHKRAFQILAASIGLQAPWKATTAGPELAARLATMASQLGPLPHPQLVAMNEKKKQTTRLRLYLCQCEKPIKVRVASDSFDATCNVCDSLFEQQINEEE